MGEFIEKINKKNWIVSGLLVLAFVFGLLTFWGVKAPVQAVYAQVSETIYVKSADADWTLMNNSCVHVGEESITFDSNSENAAAVYDQETKTLTVNSRAIAGIRASGEFDLKIVFACNYGADYAIDLQLECSNVEITSENKQTVCVAYLHTNNLTLSGNLIFKPTFFKTRAVADAFFATNEERHNYICHADNLTLCDNACFDGTEIYNMVSVDELITPSNFYFFYFGNMILNTNGYFKAGIKNTSTYPYPGEYRCVLKHENKPVFLKCDQGFYLYASENTKLSNLGFYEGISKNDIAFNFSKTYESSGTNAVIFLPVFHSSVATEDQIFLYNGNEVRKSFAQYHPQGMTYEDGVLHFTSTCGYDNSIRVKTQEVIPSQTPFIGYVPEYTPVDLVIKFDGSAAGNLKLSIINEYGNIILMSDAPCRLEVAAMYATGSIIIKGKLNVVVEGYNAPESLASGSDNYNMAMWACGKSYADGALVYAREKLVIEDNASFYAVGNNFGFDDKFFTNARVDYLIETTRLVITSTGSFIIGQNSTATNRFFDAIRFVDRTGHSRDPLILRSNASGEFKIYRNKDADADFMSGGDPASISTNTGISYSIYDHPEHNNVEVLEFTSNTTKDEYIKTIHFDQNGGSGTMNDETLVCWSHYTLPECSLTAPAGKQFAGWSFEAFSPLIVKQPGELIEVPHAGYSTTLNVVPVWEDDPEFTHTVSFNSNGGTGTMNAENTSGSYTLPACTFTAPQGKQFAGWATSSNGDVISTATINIAEDTTLFAIWEDIPEVQHTVSFNSNGGSGTMAGVQHAGTYTLPACTFTAPVGKEFDGWALSANGAKITTAQITISESTELFALWKDVEIEPQPEPQPTGLSAGAVVAIVLASVIALGLGGFAIWWFIIKKKTFADLVKVFKKK